MFARTRCELRVPKIVEPHRHDVVADLHRKFRDETAPLLFSSGEGLGLRVPVGSELVATSLYAKIAAGEKRLAIAELKRLLYVALTRAADTLVVFTDGRSKSPFLEEIESAIPLASVEWADHPPLRGLTTRLIVKIGNQEGRGGAPTYAIKDFLKASGYQWQSTGWPGWAKSFSAEGFITDILKSEIWSEPAEGIVVRIFDETDTAVAEFLVDRGNWTCIFDEMKTLCAPSNEPLLQTQASQRPSEV